MAATKVKAVADNIQIQTSTKTLLQVLAPANQRLRITEFGVTFQGVSVTSEPIEIQILRQTTAGTGTASAEVLADDDLSLTPQGTAVEDFTVEPTAGDILKSYMVHPQTGLIYPVPRPDDLIVGNGGRLGIRAVSPAGPNVDCSAYLEWEE